MRKPPPKLTPEESLDILQAASEALSHASYCQITGCSINKEAITGPWDGLRGLIECLAPKPTFEPAEPSPTLVIVPFESAWKIDDIQENERLLQELLPILRVDDNDLSPKQRQLALQTIQLAFVAVRREHYENGYADGSEECQEMMEGQTG